MVTLPDIAPPKRRSLHQGVLMLIARRGRLVAGAGAGYAWVPDDPLVGWLAPILYSLHEGEYIKLPARVEQRCRQRYVDNLNRWITWRDQLDCLRDELAMIKVPVLPLKGAAYIEQIYQDGGLRPIDDVDVLVPESRFLDAIQAMVSCELVFQPTMEWPSLYELHKVKPSEWPASITLLDPVSKLKLDVRTKLLASAWFNRGYALDPQQVWDRQVANPRLNSVWPHFLSPYDTLAHMCVSQALHGLNMLSTYVDIDTWVRKRSVSWDWGEFVRTVHQWRIRSAAYHTLSFCQALMETPLPPDLLDQLDPGTLARKRVSLLMTPQSVLNQNSTRPLNTPTLAKLALVDNLETVVRLGFSILVPEQSYRRRRYGMNASLRKHWRSLLKVIIKER